MFEKIVKDIGGRRRFVVGIHGIARPGVGQNLAGAGRFPHLQFFKSVGEEEDERVAAFEQLIIADAGVDNAAGVESRDMRGLETYKSLYGLFRMDWGR
jgi:hypothetical protein